jgi:putative ABC transport system substrate-binding protein
MNRRDLIAGLGTAIIARRAGAQLAATRRRMAFVHSSIPVDRLIEIDGSRIWWLREFFDELRRLGDFEGAGGNLQIDRYSGEGHPGRYDELARRVIETNPDLIVTVAPLVPAFRALTTTIPIAGFLGDPIKLGFVKSLARPEGNITGVSIDAGVEVYGK